MRAAGGSVALALGWALVACHAPTPSSSEIDVYVPHPADAEAGATPDAGVEGGFGLGQVDRAGRPLVNVLLVPGTLQDEYDEQPTFASTQPRVLQDAVQSRLVELDDLAPGDGGPPDPVDWSFPEGGAHPLLPMIMSDALLVDTGRSCTARDGGFVASYLEIEREIFLSGPPHLTCGGRTPNERVVDETLGLLVTGDRDGGPPPPTQGVSRPTKPATTKFPYLAAPN